MPKLKTIVTLAGLGCVLSACTMVGPDYKSPESQIEAQWDLGQTNQPKHGVSSAKTDNMQWWKSFNDPVLDRLIELGYKNNPSLQTAGVNILQARAALGQAVGELYPQQQDISASYTDQDFGDGSKFDDAVPKNLQSVDASLGATWEIDFWGKYRRAIRANNANFLASIAAYNDALVTLTAEIGSNYVAIRTYQAQINVTKQSIAAQQQNLAIVQTQYKTGQADLSDVQQATSELRQTEATLPTLNTSLQQEKDALAVLLGMTPEQIDPLLLSDTNKQLTIPVAPEMVNVGIPKDVLRQRPDVQQAELQAVAQSEEIGAVKSELYPALSLSGSFGFSSSNAGNSTPGDIFQWSNRTVSVGPSLYIPIFNYGQITNQVREQDAAFQNAIFNYQNVVLEAQQEVQDGITGFVEAQKSMQAMQQANQAAMESLKLTIVQYNLGEVDYSNVLSALQQQLDIQLSYINAQADVPQNFISLYRALGGGWQIRQDNDVISAQTKTQMAARTNWGSLLEQANHSAPKTESEQIDQTLLPSW